MHIYSIMNYAFTQKFVCSFSSSHQNIRIHLLSHVILVTLVKNKIKNLLHFTQCFQWYSMTGVHVGKHYNTHIWTHSELPIIYFPSYRKNKQTNHGKKCKVFHLPPFVQILLLDISNLYPSEMLKLFKIMVSSLAFGIINMIS